MSNDEVVIGEGAVCELSILSPLSVLLVAGLDLGEAALDLRDVDTRSSEDLLSPDDVAKLLKSIDAIVECLLGDSTALLTLLLLGIAGDLLLGRLLGLIEALEARFGLFRGVLS